MHCNVSTIAKISGFVYDRQMLLSGQKVLVTGATGFVGSHVCERATVEGAVVTGTGRNLNHVPFLPKKGIQLHQADLLEPAPWLALLAGQDVVFHVAAWLGQRHGGDALAHPVNVAATERLVQLSAQAGVKRFVLVSSITVYGEPDGTRITESRPVNPQQASLYGATKAKGEQRALALGQKLGLEVVVIRPGMVYGPRSLSWSVRMIRFIKRRIPVIFGKGDGHAYPVFIGNLVEGIMLAATRPGAINQAFNLVDPPITWRNWFGHFGDMCGQAPVAIPLWLARPLVRISEFLPLGFSVNRNLLSYYGQKTIYPTDKASHLLGYTPPYTIAEGMAQTQIWLQEQGHL